MVKFIYHLIIINSNNMKKYLWLILLLLVVVFLGVYFLFFAKQNGVKSKVDLDRPLMVGVVSWPGYAGGITANSGFAVNKESIFYKKYGLPVKFVLIEDIDARGKAFAKGGPNGVDVVWTTIDFWANELPNFIDGGVNAKAFLQVDWSRGGDAIVASESIKTVEDLKGKKIALVQYTPSHWMLESALRNSKLTEDEKKEIRKNLIFTQDVPSARSAFVAGKVDVAVVWEPDVKQALKRKGSHILISTKEMPNIIADVMVAKDDFIKKYPKTIDAFIRGWLDGVEVAKKQPKLAAKLLMDNEPMFKDLGLDETVKSLEWVYWPNLKDNARMFGLDGAKPLFDSIFNDSSNVWQSIGLIEKKIDPKNAKYDKALKTIYEGK